MHQLMLRLIYAIFFLSGASALIYEVVWVRYLSLIFGGTHLAVTTVLAVFMGGLALGSYWIGKKVDNSGNLLRLYGFLELSIAASALVFALLMRFYPTLYVPVARLADTSLLYLSGVRITFAAAALIVPTTLMGGTLPVLSAFITRRVRGLGSRLSFLYGFNTLGAVVGAAAAGFLFLPRFSVGTTLLIAVLTNVLVGVLAIVLQGRAQAIFDNVVAGEGRPESPEIPHAPGTQPTDLTPLKLVLWGVGVSGFCALGYEVLWTRILSIVIGASVYGFTILLMAFLAGIGLGSAAYGLFLKVAGTRGREATDRIGVSIVWFGLVQILIGLSALVASMYLRSLPTHAFSLYAFFKAHVAPADPFASRQVASFVMAFSLMFVPAFFMGIAFPLAGKIHGQYKKRVGHAVGEVLSFNTIGAILGSVVSGFVFVYLLGIQRSLQVIILINIGFGLLVLVSTRNRKLLTGGTAGAVTIALLALVLNPNPWNLWDTKYFAVYQSHAPEMYATPEKTRETLDNTDVLYYAEGAEAIVSSVKAGETQFFITNGRVEASNSNQEMQCQYTLGHLPMLLNKDPKKVFVLGTGSGMTLGATEVHPGVEQVTLAEIEPKVLGVARTFGIYNHYALDNPKLKIVFNDGRNFLLTTREKFDVITADPVHPWFSGAGYLYTAEYFKLAAQHLNPGGIICQWLPLYELTEENLKSIVKTFRENFSHVMVWLSYADAELVGSNSPIVIDEEALDKRINAPGVRDDLKRINMGSAEAFLSYFLTGTRGADAFSGQARINTDDNLYLEFSAPHNIGRTYLLGPNVGILTGYRESILPYLRRPDAAAAREKQQRRWEQNFRAAALGDRVHVLNLAGRFGTPEYTALAAELESRYPAYAPWRYLVNNEPDEPGGNPRLLKQIELGLVNNHGEPVHVRFSAVLIRSSAERAQVYFVDNNARTVFGKVRVRGANRDEFIAGLVDDVVSSVQSLYDEERTKTSLQGGTYPLAPSLLPQIKALVDAKADEARL
ncbi:MAG TPA: fused MFS/spermidine synthase [Nitrospirota bacterium]|nr:fused MFS/spermidine synthase [Nitrospirota bacterium]